MKTPDDSRKTKTLEPGDRMKDGTIFAGVFTDANGNMRNMFVTPKDAPGVLQWKAAMKYAAELHAHGHNDWQLPGKEALDVLHRNRQKGALKGTFNESASAEAGWYWSSTERPGDADGAWVERFSGDYRGWGWKDNDASVRPVRFEPYS